MRLVRKRINARTGSKVYPLLSQRIVGTSRLPIFYHALYRPDPIRCVEKANGQGNPLHELRRQSGNM